jgi:hypothetical protein
MSALTSLSWCDNWEQARTSAKRHEYSTEWIWALSVTSYIHQSTGPITWPSSILSYARVTLTVHAIFCMFAMVSVEIGSCRTYFRYCIGFCHSDVIWRQKLSFPTSGISIILSIVGLTSWRHLYRAHNLQSSSVSEDIKRSLLTSQKNSLPRSPQNQEIHDTSSELLIVTLWCHLHHRYNNYWCLQNNTMPLLTTALWIKKNTTLHHAATRRRHEETSRLA